MPLRDFLNIVYAQPISVIETTNVNIEENKSNNIEENKSYITNIHIDVKQEENVKDNLKTGEDVIYKSHNRLTYSILDKFKSINKKDSTQNNISYSILNKK